MRLEGGLIRMELDQMIEIQKQKLNTEIDVFLKSLE